MYVYVNPSLYGYMYYPNNCCGYAPYYPVYSNCKGCKNNVAYYGTQEKHNKRSENMVSNERREVALQEQKFIPKEFSISYPFLLKNQPIIPEQPPRPPVGPGGQGGPMGPGNQQPPRPPVGPGGQGGPMGPGNQQPPRPPMGPGGQGGPMGQGNQQPPRPPLGPGGQGGPMGPGNQQPPRPPMGPGEQGGQMGQGNQQPPRPPVGPGGQGGNAQGQPNNQGREETINGLNQAIIDKVAGLFKSQVLVPEKVDFSEVYGTYEDTLNDNGIVSILFDMYTYVDKAAHGLSVYDSITFNANTGQIYSFSDLFNPRTNYIAELNRLAQEYIQKNNVTLLKPFGGVEENQAFYLTPNSLVMYYQVYRYTPYYYGLFKIEIPYTRIRNLLGPLSPINKLI
ncbi:RsiV family protein [Alloiococcus sp. CFN-8]|uniref:RsiV family protein n=1 Tax=Alloiococcus sp. CFN-8 TaxID=3416081 RepID=UPI003CE9BC30